MKNKTKELDVDFIGGQDPLTKEEESAISAYIKAYKEKNKIRDSLKVKLKTVQKSYQSV